MEEKKQAFVEWCVVEVMGHLTMAGKVSEEEIAGKMFLRVDIPEVPGEEGTKYTAAVPALVAHTEYVNPDSIYRLTPTIESVARARAIKLRHEPIHRYQLAVLNDAAEEGVLLIGAGEGDEDDDERG